MAVSGDNFTLFVDGRRSPATISGRFPPDNEFRTIEGIKWAILEDETSRRVAFEFSIPDAEEKFRLVIGGGLYHRVYVDVKSREIGIAVDKDGVIQVYTVNLDLAGFFIFNGAIDGLVAGKIINPKVGKKVVQDSSGKKVDFGGNEKATASTSTAPPAQAYPPPESLTYFPGPVHASSWYPTKEKD